MARFSPSTIAIFGICGIFSQKQFTIIDLYNKFRPAIVQDQQIGEAKEHSIPESVTGIGGS